MIYPLTLSQNGFSSCGLKSPRPPSDWGSRQTHRTQKSYCPQSYHLLHASWQRERHMGKRVCTSVWLSSLADTPGVSDIFALLTLERLPLLELASPKPAFPARPLPVPSHWWLLPTFPPRPQSILAYPGASTCGSSWHGLPPPPVFQNTLLGGSHSAMLGGPWHLTGSVKYHCQSGRLIRALGADTLWYIGQPHNKELYPAQNVSVAEVEEPELGIMRCSVFVFGGTQRLVRSQFRNQGLNLGHSSESPKS